MVEAGVARVAIPVTVEKVADHAAIASFGVASTQGIVIDGNINGPRR
ncbi:thioredoxin family protein [Blastochloris tepida]|nr:thioredoxin family protein [Blastochloris tepida]